MNFDQYLKEKNIRLFESLSDKEYLTSNKKYEQLFNSLVKIEALPFGWDVDVFRINGKFLICKDNIIYFYEDFNYLPNTKIKNSFGISQLKFLIEHFNNLDQNSLPDNFHLRVKYIINNINYKKVHKIIFIDYCTNIKVKIKFGKIKIIEGAINTNVIDDLIDIFKLDKLDIIFNGYLNSELLLKKGCKNKNLSKLIEQNKNIFRYNDYKIFYEQLINLLFQLPSKYGDYEYQYKISGYDEFIITNPRFKIQEIKKDDVYINEIKNITLNLIENITIKSLKRALDDFNQDLKILNVKDEYKDDIYALGRQLILNKLPGNNNCLILGKFKVLTNGHIKIINKALDTYDSVTICLLDKAPLREEMIKTIYKNIDIVYNYNANFKDIFEKIDKNINVILTGSENVKKYRESTKDFPFVNVREFYRSQDSVSGEMIINRLKNKEYFIKNTPLKIHKFYDELLKCYS